MRVGIAAALHLHGLRMSGDSPTIELRLDIDSLRAIESAANAGGVAISEYAMLQISSARIDLEHSAPHGARSTLIAMAQTMAAAEYRQALAAAGAPTPWSVHHGAGRDIRLLDARGATVCDFAHLEPRQAAAVASFTMLAVNTAAGWRAVERDGALTWEIATR